MIRRVTVRGIVFKDGKLLCAKLKPYRSIKQTEFWCTPGGAVEIGESLYDGLVREMVEETGVKPEIGHLLYVQQYADSEEEQMEFFFYIKNAADYEAIDISKTTHGEVEIDQLDFIDPKEIVLLPKFLQTVNIEDNIKSNSYPQIFSYL